MLDLEPIKARVRSATLGPWFNNGKPGGWECGVGVTPDNDNVVNRCYEGDGGCTEWDDAEFIAHAREDIPALLAEVEVLRRIVAER